jgi:serine/threonine protein kinase/streptogramin lyase/pimeloyl-ACP methyl ester carboxylesterase
MGGEIKVGSEFASYRIESLLGRGGMGVVYLAEQTRLQRKVALKILPPDLAADDTFRRRFIRESQLAALLEHPNIVPIYDASEVDGVLYIAMRYVDGADLESLIKSEGPIESDRVISLLSQVASALDTAHAEGLVHRDVKPANILVARERGAVEHAFLSDFGLTRRGSSETGLTASGQFLGTVAYMAPEQIEGKAVDGHADQYSLGCVAFECLTGQKPFLREYEAAVLWAHMQGELPNVSDEREDLPKAVDEVVGRVMSKDPAARYATCAEFVDALRGALGVSQDAVPKVFRRRRIPVRLRRRLRSRPVRAVAAVLALVLALGVFLVVRPSSQRFDLPSLANVVARLDPASGAIRQAIHVGDAPSAVALDGDTTWVANRAAGSIQRIDKSGRATSVGTVTNPTAIAVGEGFVWVLGGFPTSAVSSFDLATGERGSPIDLGTNGEDIAVGEGSVWVTDLNHRALLRIDPISHQVKAIETGGIPTGVAGGKGSIWVAVDGGTKDVVLRIDPKTEAAKSISLKSRPNGIAVGDAGVWVSEGDEGAVVSIDATNDRVGRTVKVGLDPVRVASGAGAVWVANFESQSVTRIDPSTGNVKTTPLGLFPTGVAAGGGRVWVTANPETSKLVKALCPDEVPVNDPTTCWTLSVPERHTDPGGRRIQLWVERIKTPQGVTAAPDPVVVIGNNLGLHADYGGAQPLPSRTHRETINLELRGTGLSNPKLGCPEIERLPTSWYALRLRDGGRTQFLAAVKACHDRLVEQGVDLGAYNITEAAEDVEDLRRAIGVERWNLRALGYSSRVAFEVVRNFPSGIRAAWLDSPEYPGTDYFGAAAKETAEAVAALDEACGADATCHRRFPDLTKRLEQAVTSLNQQPVTVTVKDAALTKNKPVHVLIDGDLVARFVRQDVSTAAQVPLLPGHIYAAAARRFSDVPDGLAGNLLNSLKGCKGYGFPCQFPVDYTAGVAFSMLCHDEAPFTDRAALPTSGPFAEAYGKPPYLDACQVWDVGTAGRVTRAVVKTSIPVLIFNGQFDAYYAPSLATEGAKSLRRSFVYVARGLAYNVLGTTCPLDIRNAWINNPTTAPDVSCLANMPVTVTGGFQLSQTSY